MEASKENIHSILKNFESKVLEELYINANEFRGKVNHLIYHTPTGELRNIYTELNILFEQILNDYSFLLKNK